MPRKRISTTVDGDLLDRARRSRSACSYAELMDAALTALLEQDRAVGIDAAYATAYLEHPAEEPDEWGDLEAFRVAASR